MQNAPIKIFQNLSKTNLPAVMVVTALETGKTLTRYFKGEINGSQCLERLGESGVCMISSSMLATYGAVAGTFLIPIPGVGTLVGGVIGSMAGYAMASMFYNELTTALKEADLAHEERLRIEAECNAAIEAIRNYRNEVEYLVNKYLSEYQAAFDLALDEMWVARGLGDADRFISGANIITQKLGGKLQFSNKAEFDKVDVFIL